MNSFKFSDSGILALLSCEECRRRKRKCSRDKPVCALCLKNNTNCLYRCPRKRGPPKGYMLGKRSTSYISSQQPAQEKTSLVKASSSPKAFSREPSLPLYSLSNPAFALPRIPMALQTELLRTFLKHFGGAAPIFHHKYLYYRLNTGALPDFLLQTIFAIGSRFFLKRQHLETNPNIPDEWVKLVLDSDFTESAVQLAQQQIFVEPNIYNAIAFNLLMLVLFYDNRESASSTCFVLAAKIIQESGLALQDVNRDILGCSPIEGIEKEERRRFFWWSVILDRWGDDRVMTSEEQTACILPPGDEQKWQQLSFLLPGTQYRLSFEDRKLWSFMIEIEFIVSDISSLVTTILDRNKLPTVFATLPVTHQRSDLPLKLEELLGALHSWANRLPLEYQHNSFAENVEGAHTDIRKWMRISYLIGRLLISQIQATLHWNDEDMSIVRECLAIAAEFVLIVQYLPEEELIDDPSTFSYAILSCRVLHTIVEYVYHCGTSTSMAYLSNPGCVGRLELAVQAKQYIDCIHGLLTKYVTIWKFSNSDLSQLAEIKATAEHMCSRLEMESRGNCSMPLKEEPNIYIQEDTKLCTLPDWSSI
ncbi:hypothetical protein K493DRAFT_314477 [Basidiobolus meristosporus CBS 931.73]|uniref:Zn(2)-C6 fungal-type domain-containing protein n=1 Tax=Basidiobolus meristosporus CBS 931.73 TaxID=1314790 RepID=A0A1Y1YEW0_9FUNG|nr:hypothetical protein K493DRAFT_314477 [Basidiobolus meristosporus CBS 931.73]|eukprot:ORX96537.1 hypothetical protein K493DRAFT_314477 [Basidiobolus meristosporus CBS 931.73]